MNWQPLAVGTVLALATGLPLAWKWQLGMRKCAVALLVLGGVIAIPLGLLVDQSSALLLLAQWLLTLGAAAALVLWRFYRDPDRTPPSRDDVVLSPADGTVIYVRRSKRGQLPVATKNGRNYAIDDLVRTPLMRGEAVAVGISLNFLDVHVNRAPIEGEITVARRIPGLFGSLRRPEMAFENERATIAIRGRDLQVAVVLIASRLVRQIVTFVRAGDQVGLGQRLAAIRLGSQVDLVLPARPDLEVAVKPGDVVRAGESVVALIAAPERAPVTPADRRVGA